MSIPTKPNLRSLDFQPVLYEEQQMWLLRDPLGLTDYQLFLPPALAQATTYLDGSRELTEVQRIFQREYNLLIDLDILLDTVEKLDEALLLDNERSANARLALLEQYRQQPVRPPSLAGLSYPEDVDQLDQLLTAYGRDDNLDGWQPWTGRGLVSPHIDYMRGGPVYAKVWNRAAAAINEAELVLIFGTDHNGGSGKITLSRLPYATPYGPIPTDETLVDSLADAIGPEAFEEELNHRDEHSVELSAVWFHHVRRGDPCPMIPILCGSFHQFVSNGGNPAEDPRFSAFIDRLRTVTNGKRVLAVASVDLAHVGPAFGDLFVMDQERRNRLMASDRELMDAISKGDAGSFYRQIAMINDDNRICGFSSIYLMLRYLGPTTGIDVDYQHCPADTQDTSLVSICGMLLD